MDEAQVYPEEAFLLYLLRFAVEEWGLQSVSLKCPASWNRQSVPSQIRCEFSTEAVVTLTIDCGTHHLRYHTLPSSDLPGFFA